MARFNTEAPASRATTQPERVELAVPPAAPGAFQAASTGLPGESVPGATETPTPQPEGRPGPDAIQRAIAAAESRPEPAGPQSPAPERKPLQDVLPPVQRLPDIQKASMTTPAETRPQPAGAELKPEKQGDQDDLDLDELARQVYARVRRRLEIETERQHRRG